MNFLSSRSTGHLLARKPLIGVVIMYPSSGVIERIGPDWDWVWLDGQHGQFGYNDMLAAVRACDLAGRPAVVRVPGHEPGPIGLALDMGAAGIIVPCVDTPKQAAEIVRAAKFPPLGQRSYGGRRPIDFAGRNYSATANEDVLLFAQIETIEGIDNVDAIASLTGIDALFLGPDDLLLRRGLPMDAPRNRETLGPDLMAVARAARKHGKLAVTVAVTPVMQELCLEFGYDLIVCGGDVPFLANASVQASAAARARIQQAHTHLTTEPPRNGSSHETNGASAY